MTHPLLNTPSRIHGQAILPTVRGAGGQGTVVATQLYASARQLSATLIAWLSEHEFDLKSDDVVNSTRANKMTPLMHAARLGDLAITRELLSLGARLNERNIDGNNALWLACFGGNIEVVDALLAAGIDANNANDTGATTLMYAASAGKTVEVARLLAFGVDIDLVTLDDFTACNMAANLECLRLLRKAKQSQQPPGVVA